ncbi:MAG: bifunctional folylpolyglutamate synthase/dihydrofolate synthase [Clostridiales bacterium]|nr:bifunctional folylpolyglutamate synthase/dihydrofolate synthase [Clostridiales bacterium]
MATITERIAAYNRFGSRLGLDRMESLLGRLGDPHKDLRVLHVAGTNGKGSVSKYLYEMLRAGGYSVGLYISPFIEVFNERMQMDGRNIDDASLERIGDRVIKAAEAMVADGEESPTEFELVNAIAFVWYAEQGADFVVLEVGLGGRGDSTNIVEKPLVSLITSIGWDHMDRLGDTLAKIAAEKAGIIKDGAAVISNVRQEEAKAVIEEAAAAHGAPLYDVTGVVPEGLSVTAEGTAFSAEILGHTFRDVRLKMIGEHQAQNAVCALAAIELLRQNGIIKIEEYALLEGLKKAVQPGRFEVLKAAAEPEKVFVLDGAHNTDGVRSLRRAMERVFAGRRVLVVLGILADKAVDEMLDDLGQLGERFLTVPVSNPRTMEAALLADKLTTRGKDAAACTNADEAVRTAAGLLEQEPYDVCLFAGSLYLIGEIRSILRHGYLWETI